MYVQCTAPAKNTTLLYRQREGNKVVRFLVLTHYNFCARNTCTFSDTAQANHHHIARNNSKALLLVAVSKTISLVPDVPYRIIVSRPHQSYVQKCNLLTKHKHTYVSRCSIVHLQLSMWCDYAARLWCGFVVQCAVNHRQKRIIIAVVWVCVCVVTLQLH